MALIPPANAALVDAGGRVTRAWRPLMDSIARRLGTAPGCAVHAEDADAAYNGDAPAVVVLTGLASPRDVASGRDGLTPGFTRRFVNAAAADADIRDGALTGPVLKTLAPGFWCDVTFDGTVNRLTGHGEL